MVVDLKLADLYRLETVSQPVVSPDGRQVVFVLQGCLQKDNKRYQNLWLVKTDGEDEPHRLTRGDTQDGSPSWSPDGRFLAFLSTRANELEVKRILEKKKEDPEDKKETPDEDKPKSQIWVIDLERGGEPRQLTWREEGVEGFHWAPDGSRLVFASRDPDESQNKYLASIRGKDKNNDRGPVVVDRTQHKHDSGGFLDDVRTHLFIVDRESREVTTLTSGGCDETVPRWSPDGRRIVFVSNRTGDADNNHRSDLWLISPDSSECRRLTQGDVGARSPRWSPCSRQVAFVSSREPENAYLLTHLMVVRVEDAVLVADLSKCVGEGWSEIGGVVPDEVNDNPVKAARVYPVPVRTTPVQILTLNLDRPVLGALQWLDSDELLVLVGDRGQTRVAKATLEGSASFVFPVNDRMCTLVDMDEAGGTIVVGVESPTTGRYLLALQQEDLGSVDGKSRHITDFNRDIFTQRNLASWQRVEFKNSDGDLIEALVAIPPGLELGQKTSPLLVKIHGGPMAYDSPGFRFDAQYWAGQGYLIMMVNYRGSISYGEAFCQVIRGDWGPREHDDVISGVKALVDRGWADPERLFCTGFSQGGVMTNWAVGHTDMFKAAASEHGLWDYVAAFGTDDCHLWWQDDIGVPWQNEAQYRRMSPMCGAGNIKTPLLLMAGEVDWRCPLSQAEQAYVTLKKRGIPTRLVVYQGENHGINKPKRAIDRIRRISQWLSEHGGLVLDDDSAEGYPDQQ